MSIPLVKSVVKFWFWLVCAFSFTAFLGVVAFIEFSIRAGEITQIAYVYVGITGVLMVLSLIWVRSKIKSTPEMIEDFLRQIGLFKD